MIPTARMLSTFHCKSPHLPAPNAAQQGHLAQAGSLNHRKSKRSGVSAIQTAGTHTRHCSAAPAGAQATTSARMVNKVTRPRGVYIRSGINLAELLERNLSGRKAYIFLIQGWGLCDV